MSNAYTHIITDDEDGMRLDRLLAKRFGMPNSMAQKSCRKGLIRMDGKKVDASARAVKASVLELRVNLSAPTRTASATSPVRTLSERDRALAESLVLYRDRDILVLNKPSGLAVQGGSKITKHVDGLLPALQFDAKEPPRLVHRIDKDTSGLLILARTLKAARELQHQFAQKQVRKTYLALVCGVPHPLTHTLTTRMVKQAVGAEEDAEGEHEESAGGFEKMHSGEKGKLATTEYRVRDYMHKTAALVELQPITGRTHQLRVHMASIDCPIVGDKKYGTREAWEPLNIDGSQLHLHAWRIELPAMLGSKPRKFEAPLPKLIQRNLSELGLSLS